ncbi:MAG: hypothetical protein U5R48_12840 [Gammaproteobacteria bacterium]|nr:hypothetical protein [Gammaproteobacteria bacterium]
MNWVMKVGPSGRGNAGTASARMGAQLYRSAPSSLDERFPERLRNPPDPPAGRARRRLPALGDHPVGHRDQLAVQPEQRQSVPFPGRDALLLQPLLEAHAAAAARRPQAFPALSEADPGRAAIGAQTAADRGLDPQAARTPAGRPGQPERDLRSRLRPGQRHDVESIVVTTDGDLVEIDPDAGVRPGIQLAQQLVEPGPGRHRPSRAVEPAPQQGMGPARIAAQQAAGQGRAGRGDLRQQFVEQALLVGSSGRTATESSLQTRPALPQTRQDLVPEKGPVEPTVGIRRVLHPVELQRPGGCVDRCGLQLQPGPLQPAGTQSAQRRHSGQTPGTGAAQQSQQHRLRLVAGVLGREQAGIRVEPGLEAGETGVPRRRLHAPAVRDHLDPAHFAGTVEFGRAAPDPSAQASASAIRP